METTKPQANAPSPSTSPRWEPPRYQVVALDCEITAYAPDDEPLF